jgi:hypothetical protein
VSRDQRTRLNNMVAERAPSSGIQTPGKSTLTEELDEEQVDDDEVAQQPAERPRSVFEQPLQRDVDRQDADEAPPVKK